MIVHSSCNFMADMGSKIVCLIVAVIYYSRQGVDSNVIVFIHSSPAGTLVTDQPHTFDYPILSSVTLTCLVIYSNGTPVATSLVSNYRWNTTKCYRNNAHHGGTPRCFPHSQTIQTITADYLTAVDAGTISCSATVGSVIRTTYTSSPLTLRISGIALTGGVETTGSNEISDSNRISNYSSESPDSNGVLFRCITGLGPSGNSNDELGELYFNGELIPSGPCDGPGIQSRGATIANIVGAINIFLCSTAFTATLEGVYTCTMRNSTMLYQSMRVGVYFATRTAPMITTQLSRVQGVAGAPLTLSCTSEGSPPDAFTWMKDGTPITQSTSITTVTHTRNAAVFRTDYTITRFNVNHVGTYMCTVVNPKGQNSHNIVVVLDDSSSLPCPPPTDGTLQCSNGDNGTYGDICTFSCNPGYDLQGAHTGICLADQTWSGGLPSCAPFNCSARISISQHILSLVNSTCTLTYLSQCRVFCRDGFTGEDVIYLCNVTSDPALVDWIPIGGVHHGLCERVQCPPPINGTLQCPNEATGAYEDNCTFSCNPGYELQGSQNGICLANQTWNKGLPTCIPLNCPTVLNYGTVTIPSSCGLMYLSACNVSCPEGFTGDDVTYLCNVTSDPDMLEWVSMADADIMCERVHCPNLNNGIIQCSNGTNAEYEANCTFSCDVGYQLQGTLNGTCLMDGTWSEGMPVCAVFNCSTSPPLDNSQLQSSCDRQYQSICTTVCVDGYEGEGGSYICDIVEDYGSLTWNGSTHCEKVNCSQLLVPNNGAISCSSVNDQSPSHEDTCSFRCNTGYGLTGSSQRTCQSDGSWSGSPVSCTIMECPSSLLPMNSVLPRSCSGIFNKICDLQCEEGFNGSGNPSYVCNVSNDGSSLMWIANGEVWSCQNSASDENSKDDISYIPIAGGVGGTVLLMILCGVILFVRSYCKRIAYRTGNTENVSLSQLRNTRTSAPNPIYASAADLDVDYVDNEGAQSCDDLTNSKTDPVEKHGKLALQDEMEASYLQMIGPNEEPVYVMIPDCKGTIKDEQVYDVANNSCFNFDTDYDVCQRSSPDEFKVEENPCYNQITQ